mmetsp:Transcript_3206/g.11193  ORF Transcript_3206/g.11193 Transcript_3206/m.11193 type:complete len:220 (+) Transcript_3206:998-1657(+)
MAYSSSESTFRRISDVTYGAAARFSAPPIVVSSSAVKRASIWPCLNSGFRAASKTASAAATPIPLSAPRVVPLARIHQSSSLFFSSQTLMGSVLKLMGVSELALVTMSMWHWMQTPGAASCPGLGGSLKRTFPALSVSTEQFSGSARELRTLLKLSSSCDGRGVSVQRRKYFHSALGSGSSSSSLCDSLRFSSVSAARLILPTPLSPLSIRCFALQPRE